ncbi:hypothetical protein LH427_02455 [Laribacter hongkongensis]|uniref:hypothetical protein n=1 Tax=Laribacter hongkongensis TaxID=168471 RepID=UPI001EFDA745|nr:hypothetical protein [Laribacter hongkongensis]MCG8992299.1 hypothetical protein [Laribacter hongkongensis]MCG8999058.1 hypothetical protein [Laribacter hongkongensis]MCG9001727.1 hypothetical protein [Laribacter hongkongensis]MCG9004995.1 hypothetical protein [Laribacter hongkongensis]MCG9007215.1 hypothetical protein [Laribacter hongkongensis]
MYPESFGALVRYTPVWVYLFVYVVTCLIATTVFYFDYRPVMVFVEYFSGAVIPKEYTFQEAVVLWALLLGAPFLFTLGFFVAMQVRISAALPLLRKVVGGSYYTVPAWMPMLLFVTSAAVGVHDLLRAGAFAKLMVWGDYGAWVEGRWALFSTLGYFNFVNLYLILPVSAAWLILSIQGNGWKTLTKRLIPLVIVVVLTLLLFQKKALIVSLIIIFGAVLLHEVLLRGWTQRLAWLLTVSTSFLVAAYFTMVVLPIYSETSRTADDVLIPQAESYAKGINHSDKLVTSEEIRELGREVVSYIGTDRSAHILAYAALAPMTRTSIPVMHYPIVFSERHPYYGLDFGQDILGFGEMPDDNLIIWKHMYPNLPGAAGAPYQFALYSQVGVIWALMLCFIVGVVLGVMWKIILADDSSRVWRSLMGSVLILFSIYLAIDSIRGSLLASYGLIWAWLFISLFFSISNRLLRPQKT